MSPSQAAFLAAVEAYIVEMNTNPTRFGREVAGDPKFVFNLREGRSVGLELFDRVMAKMDELRKRPSPEVSQ